MQDKTHDLIKSSMQFVILYLPQAVAQDAMILMPTSLAV